MKSSSMVFLALVTTTALGAGFEQANATAIGAPVLIPQTLSIFRDNTSANDVGIPAGDELQFGVDISGGSAGDFIRAIFGPTDQTQPGFVTNFVACGPLAVNANFCAGRTPFSLSKLAGTWSIQIESTSGIANASLPSAAVIPVNPVPFPTNVTITANGNTPTISWTLPSGTSPNAFRVNIYDKSITLANGTNQLISSTNLNNPSATSFQVPAAANLVPGHSYSINFQIIDTRNNGPIPANTDNGDLLTRSSSFFDFSPPKAGQPPVIALPQVSTGGVYSFHVDNVGPNSVTFIDPKVAVGYDYAIGAGDPNFASVLLPDVGGGKFKITFTNASNQQETDSLDAGVQFFFEQGGVSAFEVTGIDPAADIDPGNALSFVTGLTFVSDGSFTGTQTPITVDVPASVPEPTTLALFGAGLAGLGAMRRRRRGVASVV